MPKSGFAVMKALVREMVEEIMQSIQEFWIPVDVVSGGGNVDASRRFENPVRLTVKN